jgi:ariadne-1
MSGADCGHRFCQGCWRNYLTKKIEDGAGMMITCPQCPQFVQDSFVRQLYSDKSLLAKYDYNLTKCYVEVSE